MIGRNMAVSAEETAGLRAIVDKENVLSMIRINPGLSSAGIFLSAFIILLFYLLGLRYEINFPTTLFFVSLAIMVFSLLYQIFFVDLSHGYSGLIILEITLASLIFHYIYQIPGYGLYGTDIYYDLASMRAILESGHLAGVREYVNITSFFPVIHIMGAEFSLLTGIDDFNTAKWFPAILGSITIPVLYLLVRQLFKQEKAALLAALLFASIQHYIMFSSLFVRETIGIMFALSSLYFYVASSSSKHPLILRGLSLAFLGGTIIAHHLTSVMFLLVLALYWVFSVFSRAPASKLNLDESTKSHRMNLSFLLIGIIGTLVYWLTTVEEPMRIGMGFLGDLLSPSTWGLRTVLDPETSGIMSLPNARYYLLIYGSYVCYLIFGLMLVYKIFSRRGSRYLETPVFTAYLLICGILGFMAYFVLPATIGGDRFLSFGWLFAVGPLALAIIEFRSVIIRAFSVILVIFFIFINLYTIHPTNWDPGTSGAGASAMKEDFAMARTIDLSMGTFIGYQNNIMTIYEEQNIVGTDAYFLLDPTEIDDFRWIIINRQGLGEEGLYSKYTQEIIEEMEQLELSNSPDYDRIYESNNLVIFKRR